MRLHSAWVIAALVLIPTAVPVAFADHDTLLSGAFSGSGWASFAISAASDEAEILLTTTLQGPEMRRFVQFFDADGNLRRTNAGWSASGSGGTTVVHADVGPLGPIHYEGQQGSGGSGFPWTSTIDVPAGEWRVLVWVSDGVGDWSYEVTGPPSDAATAGFRGEGSIDMTAEDLGQVVLSTPCCPAFVSTSGQYGAHAAVMRRVDLEMSNTFHGVFTRDGLGPFAPGVYDLRLTTPDGTEQQCPCSLHSFGPNATGPGTYSFAATSAGAQAAGFGDIRILGVDARLPGP